MDKRITDEEARRIGEKTWLNFYNQVLFEQGVIPEGQFIRMKRRIETRTVPSTPSCCRELRTSEK